MENEPSTTTITVLTRHAADCPQRANPQWKRCKCRKSIYIYEAGKVRYRSAKTRSWEQAEKVAQDERDARDPVKIRLREIEAQEAAKAANRTEIKQALSDWLNTHKNSTTSTSMIHSIFCRKIERWAAEQGIEFMDDVTRQMLDRWRGNWSSQAKRKDDRMSATTQCHFLGRIKTFFRWAMVTDRIAHDPALALDTIKPSTERTLPLTQQQFEELLAATERYDADIAHERNRWGRELRAIFLIQRWTGLRITDALALPRKALRDGRLTLITQKAKKPLSPILPDHVLASLQAVKPRVGVHPDQYFWSRRCNLHSLKAVWLMRIVKLNRYLSFLDEEGKPLPFRSHMLRDTFAVELLLAGVPLEDVSRALTHSSVRMTERYYSPWIKARQQQLEGKLVEAMRRMGATVGGQ
jgi:integrase